MRMSVAVWSGVIVSLLAVLVPSSPSQVVEDLPNQKRIREFETGLRGPTGTTDENARWKLEDRMAYHQVPGVSVAVIRDGRLAWAKGYGVRQKGSKGSIDTQTVFSVGSVSKVGAAAATLRLVDDGDLELDQDVNEFLEDWKVPDNDYTQDAPVTLRRIMSHTAGLTVHGFQDFQPGERLPTTLEILDSEGPAKNDPVLVDYVPGTRFRYSGGGTTVEQLIVEEVMGVGFDKAAKELVFVPLGMNRSSYENPLPESHGNIAKAHDSEGQPRALPRGYEAMPEAAASGLWTTPSDFALLVIALIDSFHGEQEAFLSQSLAKDMMTRVAPSEYGLGPELDDGLGSDNPRFQHGGSNESYKAWMEGHLGTRNGLVVFTNGAQGARLIAEIRRSVATAEEW